MRWKPDIGKTGEPEPLIRRGGAPLNISEELSPRDELLGPA
jgi:hypothetical protein